MLLDSQNPYAPPAVDSLPKLSAEQENFALANRGDRFAGAFLDNIIINVIFFATNSLLDGGGLITWFYGVVPPSFAFLLPGVAGTIIFLLIIGPDSIHYRFQLLALNWGAFLELIHESGFSSGVSADQVGRLAS